MTSRTTTTLVRAGVGVLTLALAATPALMGGSAEAKAKKHKATGVQFRAVTAPNTFYPVIGTKRVKDLRTYGKGHRGTDIKTTCGASHRRWTRLDNPRNIARYCRRRSR